MPVLKNARHERFCQLLATGKTITAAFAEAGFAPNDANASRTRALPYIDARVREIMEAAAARAEITAERVLAELGLVAFANMADYMQAGTDGDPYLDFSRLTRDHAAALAEVTVEDFKDGRGEDGRDVRRVKFKLHDKLSALEKIGKHLGMFKDKVEVTGKDGGPMETSVTADPRLLEIVARFGGGK